MTLKQAMQHGPQLIGAVVFVAVIAWGLGAFEKGYGLIETGGQQAKLIGEFYTMDGCEEAMTDRPGSRTLRCLKAD